MFIMGEKLETGRPIFQVRKLRIKSKSFGRVEIMVLRGE